MIAWLGFVLLITVGEARAADVEFAAQLRARLEIDAKDFDSDTDAQLFTLQRTRFAARFTTDSELTGFIQFQDSRAWGTETNTLSDASADAFDLHQGYVALSQVFRQPLTLKIGRMEMIRSNQRLVGAVGWSNTGRSFDGVELQTNSGGLSAHLWAASIRDSSTSPETTSQNDIDRYFSGLFASRTWAEENQRTDAFVLWDLDRDIIPSGPDIGEDRLNRWTIGANHFIHYQGVRASIEGAYQLGTQDFDTLKVDVKAHFLGMRAGYALTDVSWSPELAVGLDWLSGDQDPTDELGTFNTLFATNHKFYGYMDFFPRLSGFLGLRDYLVRGKVRPNGATSVAVDFHWFRSDKDDPAGENRFGYEIDTIANYNHSDNLSVQLGYSVFVPKATLDQAGVLDNAHWFFVMTTANL
ncbi:MAG: alginate export family protein [Candidatus Krumholzibacteria bacterium]|nr:alginate export family protein [Candidatus Krumholzibacteria bacterium]